MTIFIVDQVQGGSSHMPGSSKNALSPINILLKKSVLGTKW